MHTYTNYIHAYIHTIAYMSPPRSCRTRPTPFPPFAHIHTYYYLHTYIRTQNDLLLPISYIRTYIHKLHTCIHTYYHLYEPATILSRTSNTVSSFRKRPNGLQLKKSICVEQRSQLLFTTALSSFRKRPNGVTFKNNGYKKNVLYVYV